MLTELFKTNLTAAIEKLSLLEKQARQVRNCRPASGAELTRLGFGSSVNI
jgi:hypothetical protein